MTHRAQRTRCAALAVGAGAALLTTAFVTPAAAAPAPEPVLHYPLTTTSGTVARDASGHGNDGVIHGDPELTGAEGIRFDGVDDDVQLPDDILAGMASVTISMDVLVDEDQPTPYFLVGLGNEADSGSGDGYLFLSGDGFRGALTLTNWSGEQVADSGTSLDRGRWHTVAYTVDGAGDVSRLYLDGEQVAENTEPTLDAGDTGEGSTTSNFIARSNYASDQLLSGQVRDFRLYDSALSPAQVADLVPTDQVRVDRDAAALTLGDTSAVTSDLQLPQQGVNGATIEWSSSAPEVVASDGQVHRPAAGTGDVTVTLTATISRGDARTDREVQVTVLQERSDAVVLEEAAETLTVTNLDDVRGNLTLPATVEGAPSDLTVQWSSDQPEVVSPEGLVTRQATDTEVELTAALGYRDQSVTRTFTAQLRAAVDLDPMAGYAFSYFTGDSLAGENIFRAASRGNGALSWRELNSGSPVLTSSKGTGGLRDPFLIRSPEGDTFYLIATDLSIGSGTSWDSSQRHGSRALEIWESHD